MLFDGALTLLHNADNNYLLGHEECKVYYNYDQHGNTKQMPHPELINRDYADRMKYANLGGGEVWYVYDASGGRVRKVIENHNIKEERLYLEGYEVYEKTNNGEVEDERETLHVMDGEKRIAILDTTTTTTIRYQYDNHLGSACLELDQDAEIISYEEYHPGVYSAFCGEQLLTAVA